MIKLLWVGDAVAHTGFSRVTHSILDELHKTGEYDINVLGINYSGDPHSYPYNIYPAFTGGDMFGVNRFPHVLQELVPDVIFIVQDIWNIAAYLQKVGITGDNKRAMPRLVIYFPLDAPGFKPEWAMPLRAAAKVCVYTQFAKDIVQPYTPTEVEIIPHGINTDIFHPVADARQHLKGVSQDWEIIGNVNRNQPRKRIDLTLDVFAAYCQDKPEARLYYHGALNDAVGMDIIDYAKRLKIWDKLIITDPNMTAARGVPTEVLNWIYNSLDVQINTGLGEGWGLPNFEGAACGVPQVVPNWSATKEIYGEDRGLLIDIDRPLLSMQQLNTIGGLIDVRDAVEKLNILHYHPEIKRRLAHNCFKYINQPKFQWSNIAGRLDTMFKQIVECTKVVPDDNNMAGKHNADHQRDTGSDRKAGNTPHSSNRRGKSKRK